MHEPPACFPTTSSPIRHIPTPATPSCYSLPPSFCLPVGNALAALSKPSGGLCALFPLGRRAARPLAFLQVVCQVGLGQGIYPLLVTFASDACPGREAAVGLPLFSTIGFVGGFLGPWITGILVLRFDDYDAAVAQMGLSLFTVGVMVLLLRWWQPPRSRLALWSKAAPVEAADGAAAVAAADGDAAACGAADPAAADGKTPACWVGGKAAEGSLASTSPGDLCSMNVETSAVCAGGPPQQSTAAAAAPYCER